MDSLPLFIRGLIVGIIVAAPMGPVNVLCIHRTVTRGRLNGFLTGFGAAIGDGVFALAAALGLTAVEGFVRDNEFWFRLPGGILLLFIAVLLWRSHPHYEAGQANGTGGIKRTIAATFALTISNPITLAAFVTFFLSWGLGTGFDIPAAANVVLGVLTGSTLWWLFLVTVTGLLHGQIKDKYLVMFNRTTAVAVVAFGLYAIDSVTLQVLS